MDCRVQNSMPAGNLLHKQGIIRGPVVIRAELTLNTRGECILLKQKETHVCAHSVVLTL